VTTTRTLTAGGILASCVPMVAMLPSAVSGALGLIGLGASSAAVATLNPALSDIAQPLLLASIAVLAVSDLRCSRAAVALAASGGALLYLAMYVLTAADGMTSPPLFYAGLAVTLAAYVVSWRNRRGLRCRPLVSSRLGTRLLVSTLAAATLAVGLAALSTGSSSNRSPTRHQVGTSSPRETSPSGAMPGMTNKP
jgi:hypothetical protein